MKEKIAIVGSRDFPDKRLVIDYVNSLPEGTEVVTGGARGVDTWAEEAARLKGLTVTVFLPYFKRPGHKYFGRYAKWHFFARNDEIVDYCDKLVAFWDGKSKGTNDTIKKAQKKEKEVIIKEPRKER